MVDMPVLRPALFRVDLPLLEVQVIQIMLQTLLTCMVDWGLSLHNGLIDLLIWVTDLINRFDF